MADDPAMYVDQTLFLRPKWPYTLGVVASIVLATAAAILSIEYVARYGFDTPDERLLLAHDLATAGLLLGSMSLLVAEISILKHGHGNALVLVGLLGLVGSLWRALSDPSVPFAWDFVMVGLATTAIGHARFRRLGEARILMVVVALFATFSFVQTVVPIGIDVGRLGELAALAFLALAAATMAVRFPGLRQLPRSNRGAA